GRSLPLRPADPYVSARRHQRGRTRLRPGPRGETGPRSVGGPKKFTDTEGVHMVDTAHRNTGVEGVAGGVGVTALLVAAARAIETHRPDSLARDAYAEHFVRAAPASTGWPVHPREVPDGDENPLWGRFARYFGL